MLVTLDLIASNVYNSVKGPTLRGFSFIEIWNVGVQFPILLGIFEFGVILAMKRYYKAMKKASEARKLKKGNSIGLNEAEWDLDKIARVMDTYTFFASLAFIILFNVIFWTVARMQDPDY